MGEPLSPAANGNSVSWSGSVALHPDWVEEEMYVLAFIEDITHERIENAGNSLQTTTSVIEPPDSKNISLFPNPTANQIRVSGLQVSQWKLISVMGTTLAEGGPLNNQPVSLLDHPAGPYFLRLQDVNGEWRTFKVIKIE
jgi:hypothetical protein